MQTYVALIRGINVSGKNIIKMTDLTLWLSSLGFHDIHTYKQSGNVVFKYKKAAPSILCKAIADCIKAASAIEVPVLVIQAKELKSIMENNPLHASPELNQDFWHLTFLSQIPSSQYLKRLEKSNTEERVEYTDKYIYLYCPNGYGNTKWNNNYFESRLKVTATTRNWKTMLALLAMTEEK